MPVCSPEPFEAERPERVIDPSEEKPFECRDDVRTQLAEALRAILPVCSGELASAKRQLEKPESQKR
jgi:hypothetical protein